MKILISESQKNMIVESLGTYKDIPAEEMEKIKKDAEKEYQEKSKNSGQKDVLIAQLAKLSDILDDPSNDKKMSQLKTPNEKQKYYKELEAEYEKIKGQILNFKEESFEDILRRKLNEFLYRKTLERIQVKNEIEEDDLKTVIEDVINSSNYSRFFNFDMSLFNEKLIDKIEVEEKDLATAISEYIFEDGEVPFLIGEFRQVKHIDEIGKEKYWKWITREVIYVKMDNILEAISQMKKKYPKSYKKIVKESSELKEHNIFFQLMLFKEIKYKV